MPSIVLPSADAIAACPPATVLTPSELDQLHQISAHFADAAFQLAEDGKNGRPTGLSDGERYWLSRECLLRYLNCSKGDARHAISKIQATLLWRREIGVDQISADEVSSEGVCGKAFLLGYSTHAEPLFYIMPSRRDTEPSETQFRHIVYLWERCIDLMGPGMEGAVVLLDFAGKSKRPSVTMSTRILSMMTHHYPSRVAAAFIQNTPFVLNAFLSVVWPFIDPSTRDKIDTKGRVGGRVDKEVLVKDWHGQLEFTYDHATYWPYLLALAGDKRATALARWAAAGKPLFASERDLRRWEDGVADANNGRAPSPFDEDVKRAVNGEAELPILV